MNSMLHIRPKRPADSSYALGVMDLKSDGNGK